MKEELARRIAVATRTALTYEKFVAELCDGLVGDVAERRLLKESFSGDALVGRIASIWAAEANEDQLIRFVALVESQHYQQFLDFANTVAPIVRAAADAYMAEIGEKIVGSAVKA